MEMEKNNSNVVNNSEVTKKEILEHLYCIQTPIENPIPQPITRRSSLAEEMKGLDFETQKKLLNAMAKNGTYPRSHEHSIKRYTADDIYNMNVSLQDSIKILINEAAMTPRADLKNVTAIVNEFQQMRSDACQTVTASLKNNPKL